MLHIVYNGYGTYIWMCSIQGKALAIFDKEVLE